jgi:hypothetical protein
MGGSLRKDGKRAEGAKGEEVKGNGLRVKGGEPAMKAKQEG